MKKFDLILLLAARENLTEVQAARIIKLIFEGFTDALVKGERIEIRGFGSFAMRIIQRDALLLDDARDNLGFRCVRPAVTG